MGMKSKRAEGGAMKVEKGGARRSCENKLVFAPQKVQPLFVYLIVIITLEKSHKNKYIHNTIVPM